VGAEHTLWMGFRLGLRCAHEGTLSNYLRAGAMILMPTDAIHTDTSIWGGDVLAFNYRRFHPSNPHKPPAAAFRSFGGGTTLCPGRHFGTTQTMAWTVMMVMRFWCYADRRGRVGLADD